jgi:5-(carboxyamino)imidazole ribonucleotide mutase
MVIAVIMGSKSDLNVMNDAVSTLKDFGVDCDCDIVSAHRDPKKMFSFASTAIDKGYKIIIAGAGGAAHLPGMVASLTSLPVIGVPIKSSNSIQGIDSLLSIVQMPKGVPVATVSINGAINAAILALRILSISDDGIREKLEHKMK